MPTVLVVDDTTLARESVARLLEHEGFKTVRARNGKDGWATMYETTPDLILLDLAMPQMDGVTFLRMIRRSERWHDLPVIVLTGMTDDNHLVAKAKALGILFNTFSGRALNENQDLHCRHTAADGLARMWSSGTVIHELSGAIFHRHCRCSRSALHLHL